MLKFKKTPIGEIPENWEIVKLGKIISYIKGKKPKIVSEEPKDKWLPYLSTEYLRGNNATQFVKITGNEVIAQEEDILLLWDGSNAGEFFLAKKGVLSSTMVKISLKKDVYDKLFLFYLLKHREPFLKGQTKGTGIPHVDKNVLNALLLPLPPLPEQRKIAEILRTVDEAIEKTDLAIERTERLKKGLMQRLLTKGIRHERFKKTELGEIPEEWQVVRLGEIVLPKEGIKRGPWGSMLKKESFVKNGFKVYEQKNVILNNFNIGSYYITQEKFQELKNYEINPGDILITSAGTIGKIAIVPKGIQRGIFNQALIRIRLNREKISNIYFKYLFESMILENQLKKHAYGATQVNLASIKILRNLKIPLPPLPEQKQIAEILSTVDRKLELLRERRERLERIKRGLMKDLLTGRRRVID